MDISQAFLQAINPETPKETLESLLQIQSRPLKLALVSQKKMPIIESLGDSEVELIQSLKIKNHEDCLEALADALPSEFLTPLFSQLTNSERLTNYLLKKDPSLFDVYIKSLFKQDDRKEEILQQKLFYLSQKNPQKEILKTLLKDERFLGVMNQKKIPAWVLDEVVKILIANKNKKNMDGIDLVNFINSYVIDNRNLSVDSAILLYESFKGKVNYGKAFKIKHRVLLNFVKEQDSFYSLQSNYKIKPKTFYALKTLMDSSSDQKKKREIVALLVYNPCCPSDIIKSLLLTKSPFVTSDMLLSDKTKHIQKPEFYSLILKKFSKTDRLSFYSRWKMEDIPEKFLREYKMNLKDLRTVIIKENPVNFSKLKEIEETITKVNEKMSKSSNPRLKLSAIF